MPAKRSVARKDARLVGETTKITRKWQEDMVAALKRAGITEPKAAERIGCAQSTVYTTLHSKTAKHSNIVSALHKLVGWDPPPDPQAPVILPSPDAIELARMYDRLPERVRSSRRAVTASPRGATATSRRRRNHYGSAWTLIA